MRAKTKSPYTKRDDAAVLLQPQFERTARKLACGDASLADDLRQVMSESVLRNRKAVATLGWYANAAKQDAQDERRKHHLRNDANAKQRYIGDEKSGRCRERADVGACARDSNEGRATRGRGRPRHDSRGVKCRRQVVWVTDAQRAAIGRLAKRTGQTLVMLYLSAHAMLAGRLDEGELARELVDV